MMAGWFSLLGMTLVLVSKNWSLFRVERWPKSFQGTVRYLVIKWNRKYILGETRMWYYVPRESSMCVDSKVCIFFSWLFSMIFRGKSKGKQWLNERKVQWERVSSIPGRIITGSLQEASQQCALSEHSGLRKLQELCDTRELREYDGSGQRSEVLNTKQRMKLPPK